MLLTPVTPLSAQAQVKTAGQRLLPWLLVLALGATLCPGAIAGAFSITPVRIYMQVKDRAVALTLINEGDTELGLQAELFDWKQNFDGSDVLNATEDVVLSPPIIKLAPRGRQVVRLALLNRTSGAEQRTYRLIVREVPELTPPQGNVIQIPIALALSIPVFVNTGTAQRALHCELDRRRDNASLDLRCANQGKAYTQIREVRLTQAGAELARLETGAYILPGAQKTLAIALDKPVATGATRIELRFDDGQSQTLELQLP